MAKRGRPHKPYRTSDGKYIDGLARRPDGRWVILSTGERFSESDEQRAIDRFRASCPNESAWMPVNPSMDIADNAEADDQIGATTELQHIEHEDGSDEIGCTSTSGRLTDGFPVNFVDTFDA